LQTLMFRWCDEHMSRWDDRKGDFTRMIRDCVEKWEPVEKAGRVTFAEPKPTPFLGETATTASGFILQPITRFDGWFPKGDWSVVFGASGSCKTSLLLEMLDALKQGKKFLNHTGVEPATLFLLQDRGFDAFYETLDRMRVPRDFVALNRIPPQVWSTEELYSTIGAFIQDYQRPPLVVIEGADLLRGTKAPAIIPMLTQFQKMAKHYGIALVGTWGSPKRQSNPREAYKAPRDAASGSAVLARMSTTMVSVTEDYDNHQRSIHVEHRNAKSEKHTMHFVNDRLVERVAGIEVGPVRTWTAIPYHGFNALQGTYNENR
jgi:hypothetical protein